MSILYDYLKVLEKKKGKAALELQAPVQQKNKFSLFYFTIGLAFLIGILALALFLGNIKSNAIGVSQKINNIPESAKPVAQNSISASPNNAYGVDYSLKGIIYNSDSPSAIINDKLVSKNAQIGDWLVIDISPAQVTLENPKNSSQLTLKLNSPSGQQ
jgi:hypothetical protein